jgi:hypothetical protein
VAQAGEVEPLIFDDFRIPLEAACGSELEIPQMTFAREPD